MYTRLGVICSPRLEGGSDPPPALLIREKEGFVKREQKHENDLPPGFGEKTIIRRRLDEGVFSPLSTRLSGRQTRRLLVCFSISKETGTFMTFYSELSLSPVIVFIVAGHHPPPYSPISGGRGRRRLQSNRGKGLTY